METKNDVGINAFMLLIANATCVKTLFICGSEKRAKIASKLIDNPLVTVVCVSGDKPCVGRGIHILGDNEWITERNNENKEAITVD